MPRLVRFALLFSSLFHGALVLAARYRSSYDAYVHMFFADHYRRDWWSLWDERWYTGFPITSYPPLVHQLIAGLSHGIGLDAAYGLVLWITVSLFPLAVYCFARVFAGQTSSGYAALAAAFLPSLYLTAHIFGQLPFLFGTLLALFGAASLSRYLEEGRAHNFLLAAAITTTTMAAHHAVLLVQPFLIFAVLLKTWYSFREGGLPVTRLAARLILFGFFAIACCLLVIFPFWEWGQTQTIQTPIDHASRHNFFQDPRASLLFFLPMYGPLLAVIPFAIFMARKRQFIGLGISFFLLLLLGLGGTTPLPRLFFGRGWEWLTYDRFALWASLLLLPFFGRMVIQVRQRRPRLSLAKLYGVLAVSSLIVVLVPAILPLQPGPVDMEQIVYFLEQEDHRDWRYLTFGFGDQLALLSTLTTVTTIDGSYHTARTLPELRSSGIAQIDTAFWFPDGLSALDPILQKAGDHGVRWGFVNTPQYIPVLERNSWSRLATFAGGVQVWENPGAILPPASKPPPANPLASFAWGTFPLLSLVTTLSLASLKLYPLQTEKVLRGAYTALVGLIPLSLCFWYYKVIAEFPHPRVYFTYDHALLFMSDALAIMAILVWGAVRIAQPAPIHFLKIRDQHPIFYFFLSLFLLSSLSLFWSSDWRTSLYISLHLGVVFLLFLSLRDWGQAWKPLIFGLCAALAFQIIAGFTGFALQSTAFLEPLEMQWPGFLDASVRGASVVELQNKWRVLRAYGTLPHPNILGGFTLICLLGPATLFLAARRMNLPALFLYILGIIVLMLTFSRSAWLGLAAFLLLLVLKSRYLDRKRLFLLLSASVLTISLTLFPLRDLVFTRITNAPVPTEQLSSFGRSWLTQQAVDVIEAHPLTGVGIGSFVLVLAEHAVVGALIEPVHNIFLLVGTELGVFGVLCLVSLLIAIGYKIIAVRRPQAILTSATLAGLGIIGFFDHYLWSIAPGRLMLGLALGLWAGQVVRDDA